MIDFAEELTLSRANEDWKPVEFFLVNLEQISGCILQCHYAKLNCPVKVSIRTNDMITKLSQAFVFSDEQLFSKFVQPMVQLGMLQNFVKLIANVGGFRQIQISKLRIPQINAHRQDFIRSQSDYQSKMILANLEYARGYTESLIFNWCEFYGNIEYTLLAQYRNLKKLHMIGTKILDTCLFREFPKLEEFVIQNTIVLKLINLDGKAFYKAASVEITFELLARIIYGRSLNRLPMSPSNLKVLFA
ncbi:hypothetical protein FGO68_gene13695 [Halteria grandinella]|uniref:Uncharacterized protein n=1 Tax=Halteria grandinella TaxID=5974 RepID=A0A8J8NSK6_HALGN|nr:hypothetical protein FGO68_gene13695 [Halteria grandinella]